MSKPSILLIPGSFGLPEFYNEVLDAVTARGHAIHALHLPTVGVSTGQRGTGNPTMQDDAAFIAKATEELADQGKDVILVAHSYGGAPTTQSTKGLGKAERAQQGKAGGIVNIAYMTCITPDIGGTTAAVLADVPQEQRLDIKADEAGWLYHDQPSATAAVTLNHLSPDQGKTLIERFPKHSAASFIDPLTHAGYKDIPVSYLLCEDDLCIPPNIQRAGIEMIEKESGRKVDVTAIKADHCPNVTSTQEVVDWICGVAKKYERAE